jgi:hypothetical protein
MEIKRNPEFFQPPKIPGNPPQKNEGTYCDFHEQRGHYNGNTDIPRPRFELANQGLGQTNPEKSGINRIPGIPDVDPTK